MAPKTFTLKTPIFFGLTGDWQANGVGNWGIGSSFPTPSGAAKSGIVTFTFTTASIVETSDNGNFTVGTVIPGFRPRANLLGHIVTTGTVSGNTTFFSREISSIAIVGGAVPPSVDLSNILIPDNTSFSDLWGGFSRVNVAVGTVVSFWQVDIALVDIFITGEYDILAYTYTMDPPDGSSVDAGPNGNLITISSVLSDPNHLKLNHLTISVLCGPITIVEQTETTFSFYLPEACDGAGATEITATGDGTQFSGSVALGTLIILLTNASGIYTLSPGKSNDTLYSSLRDGTTRDVKIPNPTARTGFIGG